MTSRELLRAVADELLHEDDWPQGRLAGHAAALRALADRFDAEEADARYTLEPERTGLLARLDAPQEPRNGME